MIIKNFCKSYKDNNVYNNFNLELQNDKITCILGASGSGKTTLLNAVAGLIDYSGYIDKVTTSYIFQSPNLVPNLTVFDNLKLVCNDKGAINDILQKAEIADKAKSYPKNLSGGQAQRVAIARAFIYPADIILMDEPFSSLDIKLKIKLMQLFLNLHKSSGRGAIFVTHDIDEATYLSDRIIVISNGKVQLDLSNTRPQIFSTPTPARQTLLTTLMTTH
jgi:ABC-type nitrate/sulfonate/bicarbonate transport system ATPase subunit